MIVSVSTLQRPRVISMVVFCLFTWLVLTPLQLFYMWRFWIYQRSKKNVRKKHLVMNAFLQFFLFCLVSINRPLRAITFALSNDRDLQDSNDSWDLILARIIFIISLYGILYSFLWRIWIIYFDHELMKLVRNHEWRKALDETYLQRSWFKSHRNSVVGSYRKLGPILAVISLIFASGHIIVFLEYGRNNNIAEITYQAVSFLIPSLLIAGVWSRTPQYQDMYHIRSEIKMALMSATPIFVAFIITALLGDKLSLRWYVRFCEDLAYVVSCTLIALSSTAYVLYLVSQEGDATVEGVVAAEALKLPNLSELFDDYKRKQRMQRIQAIAVQQKLQRQNETRIGKKITGRTIMSVQPKTNDMKREESKKRTRKRKKKRRKRKRKRKKKKAVTALDGSNTGMSSDIRDRLKSVPASPKPLMKSKDDMFIPKTRSERFVLGYSAAKRAGYGNHDSRLSPIVGSTRGSSTVDFASLNSDPFSLGSSKRSLGRRSKRRRAMSRSHGQVEMARLASKSFQHGYTSNSNSDERTKIPKDRQPNSFSQSPKVTITPAFIDPEPMEGQSDSTDDDDEKEAVNRTKFDVQSGPSRQSSKMIETRPSMRGKEKVADIGSLGEEGADLPQAEPSPGPPVLTELEESVALDMEDDDDDDDQSQSEVNKQLMDLILGGGKKSPITMGEESEQTGTMKEHSLIEIETPRSSGGIGGFLSDHLEPPESSHERSHDEDEDDDDVDLGGAITDGTEAESEASSSSEKERRQRKLRSHQKSQKLILGDVTDPSLDVISRMHTEELTPARTSASFRGQSRSRSLFQRSKRPSMEGARLSLAKFKKGLGSGGNSTASDQSGMAEPKGRQSSKLFGALVPSKPKHKGTFTTNIASAIEQLRQWRDNWNNETDSESSYEEESTTDSEEGSLEDSADTAGLPASPRSKSKRISGRFSGLHSAKNSELPELSQQDPWQRGHSKSQLLKSAAMSSPDGLIKEGGSPTTNLSDLDEKQAFDSPPPEWGDRNPDAQATTHEKFNFVLMHEEYFDIFMQHVAAEFSIENMLALIELCQFQDELIKLTEQSDKRITFQSRYRFKFYSRIPRSALVDSQRWDIWEKTKLLYEKYIMMGAVYELNLSAPVREKWKDFIREYEHQNEFTDKRRRNLMKKMGATDTMSRTLYSSRSSVMSTGSSLAVTDSEIDYDRYDTDSEVNHNGGGMASRFGSPFKAKSVKNFLTNLVGQKTKDAESDEDSDFEGGGTPVLRPKSLPHAPASVTKDESWARSTSATGIIATTDSLPMHAAKDDFHLDHMASLERRKQKQQKRESYRGSVGDEPLEPPQVLRMQSTGLAGSQTSLMRKAQPKKSGKMLRVRSLGKKRTRGSRSRTVDSGEPIAKKTELPRLDLSKLKGVDRMDLGDTLSLKIQVVRNEIPIVSSIGETTTTELARGHRGSESSAARTGGGGTVVMHHYHYPRHSHHRHHSADDRSQSGGDELIPSSPTLKASLTDDAPLREYESTKSSKPTHSKRQASLPAVSMAPVQAKITLSGGRSSIIIRGDPLHSGAPGALSRPIQLVDRSHAGSLGSTGGSRTLPLISIAKATSRRASESTQSNASLPGSDRFASKKTVLSTISSESPVGDDGLHSGMEPVGFAPHSYHHYKDSSTMDTATAIGGISRAFASVPPTTDGLVMHSSVPALSIAESEPKHLSSPFSPASPPSIDAATTVSSHSAIKLEATGLTGINQFRVLDMIEDVLNSVRLLLFDSLSRFDGTVSVKAHPKLKPKLSTLK